MEKNNKNSYGKPSQSVYRKTFLVSMSIIIALFLINSAIAMLEVIKPIEIIKGEQLNFNGKLIDYNPLWKIYSPIQIKDNWNLPLISSIKAEMYLTKHTSTCGSSCSSEMQIYIANDGALIDDVKFLQKQDDGIWVEKPIRSYQFYIKTGGTEWSVDDYETQCNEKYLNGSEKCSQVKLGKHYENDYTYKPYTLGEEVKAGTYYIKLEGTRTSAKWIDWQITSQGKLIDDWAVWGDFISSFSLNAGNGNPSGVGTNGSVIAVSDIDDDKAYIYDMSGVYIKNWAFNVSNTGGDGIKWWNGYWYVIDENDDRIYKYDSDGLYTSACKIAFDSTYYDLTINGTNIWVSGAGRLDELDMNCALVHTYSGDSWGLAMNGSNLYVLNHTGDGTITKFNFDGSSAGQYFNLDASQTFSRGLDIYQTLFYTAEYISPIGVFEYYNAAFASLTPILNSPVDYYNSTTNTVTFNCSATAIGGATISNISLWTNQSGSWVLNHTIDYTGTGGATNTSIFNKNFADDKFDWTCKAYDSNSVGAWASENRTISIDTQAPQITINLPTKLLDYGYAGKNESLNWSITDVNLASVWYNYNGTNKTLNGAINSTTFNLAGSPYNLTLYANDSLGNVNSQSINWSYNVFENNHSFTTPVTSGDSNTFSINFTYDSSFTGISTLLNYNNTNYTMSSSDTGTTKTYTQTLTAPIVTSTINNTFKFIILLSNSSGTTQLNSPSYNQTVNPFLIDNCTANSNVLLNMTMIDEETLLGINGTIEVLVNIYGYGTSNLIAVYNRSFNYIDPIPATVCINSTGNYRLDYTIKHYGNETYYFKKFRNIQNQTITATSYTQQLQLYNLLIASAYTFRITITGTTLNNLLVSVYKQYIPQNTFNLVESPLTSSNREAVAHLIPSSANYRFVVSYMGQILGTFENNHVTCENPSIGQCTFILSLQQNVPDIPSFGNYLNISVMNILDNSTHTLTTTYVSTNGESHTIRQYVFKNDGYGNTTICNNTGSGTSGTIPCVIPIQYQNNSFFLQIIVDGKLRGTGFFTQGSDPDYYGVDILIEIMMFTTLVMMMLGHPILIVIGAMLGLVFSIILLYISGGHFAAILSAAIFFVVAGIIIIWQVNRKF